MNTLKSIFFCALFAVTGCVGGEPTDDTEVFEGAPELSESDVASVQETLTKALPVEDDPNAKPVCWDDGEVYCCGSGGTICCLIEGWVYCA